MNKMTFNEFKIRVNKLRESREKMDKWMARVPEEVQSAFFDNPYIIESELTTDWLIKELFGELVGDVSWFLHDFEENTEQCCVIDGETFIINTANDFFESVKQWFDD